MSGCPRGYGWKTGVQRPWAWLGPCPSPTPPIQPWPQARYPWETLGDRLPLPSPAFPSNLHGKSTLSLAPTHQGPPGGWGQASPQAATHTGSPATPPPRLGTPSLSFPTSGHVTRSQQLLGGLKSGPECNLGGLLHTHATSRHCTQVAKGATPCTNCPPHPSNHPPIRLVMPQYAFNHVWEPQCPSSTLPRLAKGYPYA